MAYFQLHEKAVKPTGDSNGDLLFNNISRDPFWCFVKEIRYDSSLLDQYKSIIFIFLAGKFWEILTYFGVIIMYAHIAGHISRLRQHYPLIQARIPDEQVQHELLVENRRFKYIPVFFLLLRIWGTVQLFYSIGMAGKNHDGCLPPGVQTGYFILGIVQAIGDPGQGWSNAILYIFMSPVMRKRLFCRPSVVPPRAPSRVHTVSTNSLTGEYPSPDIPI